MISFIRELPQLVSRAASGLLDEQKQVDTNILGAANRYRALLAILVLALAARALCAFVFSGEIDEEGAEYARIAQNLRLGLGYSGIATEGTQLFFPPLFPTLIAGMSMLTGNAEIAGRLVSILFGALLVLPVYSIAKRLFGGTAGLGAAALVALHPYLVYLSTTVYCETTYITLLLSAISTTMAAADRPDWQKLVQSGLLYGLAYLVRPEAAAFVLVGATCFLLQRTLRNQQGARVGRQEFQRVGVVLACFVLLAGPYIIWLSLQTGEFRLQAKSPLNLATELQVQQGLTGYAASFMVGPDLIEKGTYNRSNIEVISTQRLGIADYARILRAKLKEHRQNATVIIAGAVEFGSPVLFILVILGLFYRSWSARVALDQLHLIVVLAMTIMAPLFIYYSHVRFYVLVLVVFCIWSVPGLQQFAKWSRSTALAWGGSEGAQRRAGRAAAALAVLLVLGPSALSAAGQLMRMRGTQPIKALSLDLSESQTPLRIADSSTPFSFHARAEFVWLPCCEGETALKYLTKKQVTHVALRSSQLHYTPYLRSWFEQGLPGATLVAEANGRGDHMKVFRIGQVASAR